MNNNNIYSLQVCLRETGKKTLRSCFARDTRNEKKLYFPILAQHATKMRSLVSDLFLHQNLQKSATSDLDDMDDTAPHANNSEESEEKKKDV